MNLKLLSLILVSVSISAVAQLVLKTGMSSSRIQEKITGGPTLELLWGILTNVHVLLGLSMYGFGAMLWLLVLAKVDVSFAYPFVGLGFLLTMLFGFLFLREPVGLIRLIGTLLVAFGVVLVSRS